MDDRDITVNEFMQYCNALDEDCPVVLYNVLALLKTEAPAKPKKHINVIDCASPSWVYGCGRCGGCVLPGWKYCPFCRTEIRWKG